MTRYRPPMFTNLLALCLMLVVALRALVPMGYMPVAQDGGLRMVICTANGAVAVTTPGSDHDTPSAQDSTCIFAAAGFTHDGATAGPDITHPVTYAHVARQLATDTCCARGSAADTSARAPPAPVVI